jgi:polar amino acid transport system substrate-binding protein
MSHEHMGGRSLSMHALRERPRTAGARSLRFGLVLLGLLGLLGETGCQSFGLGGSGGSGARLRKIIDSGELRVGITGNQPPLNMKNKQGELIGFEVDVIESLASSMGLEATFVELPFPDLLSSLESGDVDLVISGVTITPERNTRVAFVGPYFITGKSVLARSDKLEAVDETTELNDPARSYATLARSTSEDFVRDVLPKARLVTTSNYDAAVQMVIDGKVDALIADAQICKVSAWRFADKGLATISTPFTIEPLGIALPADAPLLVNLVENFLDTLEYTGLLSQYKARWLSDESWLADLP